MVQERDGGLGLDNEERLPWLEPVDDLEDDNQASPARLLAMVLGGLILIGAVLGSLWWFQNGGPRGDSELIVAEAGDYKVAPTSDGAKVFEGEGDAAFAASEGLTSGGVVDPNRLPEEPAVTPEEREAAALAAAAAAKKVAAEKAAPAPVASTTREAEAAKQAAAEKAAAAAKLAAEKAAAAKRAADASQARAPVSAGTVQLGAFSSEGAANKAWMTLSNRFGYLADYNRSIAPAKVGDKTVYRLRLGAGSTSRANELCQKLRVAGEGCVIVR
jgi:hypothetical protein